MKPAAGLAALLLCAQQALAQSTPDEQARSLLEDGRGYLSSGKTKQALDNFHTIVTGFSNTDAVDDAWLEIGRHAMEVEGDAVRAREAFEQVATRYPQSDGAPGAYCHLGLLALRGARVPAQLEDALAQFARVQRLYPRSEWVPRALVGTAHAYRRLGKLPEAIDAGRRASLEYPSNEATPEAHFVVGELLALTDEPRRAMEEFQQIRNRFPRSPWAARALDRVTALYRLHGGAQPSFSSDPAFAVAGGDVLEEVRGLLMTGEGTLWIASAKAKGAFPYASDGKPGPGVPAAEPRGLSLSPRGDVLLAARTAIRLGTTQIQSLSVPGDRPGAPETLERIEAAVVTPGGHVLVADLKRKRVYRFDAQYKYLGDFPDPRPREVTRMTLDGEGGVVLLDREARSVSVYDETGKLLRTLPAKGAGYELRRPADVAVDPFGNLYVADEEGAVLVFSARGRLLASVGDGTLRKPSALTLDPSGALLVYDDRVERVLRYR